MKNGFLISAAMGVLLCFQSYSLAQLSPTGPESQVNTYVAGSQQNSSVAMTSDGSYIITWESRGQEGWSNVYAQRYDSNGNPLGGEFRVNALYESGYTNQNRLPKVATAVDGSFVITWAKLLQPSGMTCNRTYFRRFNAAGIALDDEKPGENVRCISPSWGAPSIAVGENGDYVLSWSGWGGIYQRPFDSSGSSYLWNATLVNTYWPSTEQGPIIGMAPDGSSYVIAWSSYGQDGSRFGVFAQRYTMTNGRSYKSGPQFQVNTYTPDHQAAAGVAIAEDGAFIITWTSRNQDGSGYGVYAQRFDPSANPLGSELHVTDSPFSQTGGSVAMANDGSFVITWTSSEEDGSGYGVFAKMYDSSGISIGGDFRVNFYVTGNQSEPSIAMTQDGKSFVISWTSDGQDGSGNGVFARHYKSDSDGDGVDNSVDNCPLVYNPPPNPGDPQPDRDNNGIGDACDGDFDGDTVPDVQDNCPVVANEFQDDWDDDDIGDACDACFDDATNACMNAPPQTISENISYPVTLFNGAATASVTVEPGNLKGDTTIQITGETGSSNFAYGSGQHVLGAVYTFTATPAGNPTFNSPGVTITLSYEQGNMREGSMTEQRLDIYWYNTGTQQWEAQPILERNMIDNTLSIHTTHFSSYAVIAIENPVGDLLDVLKDVAAGNQGIKSSFIEKVQYAYDLYEAGDSTGARNNLKAFTNQLKALSGKKIDAAYADMLIEFAGEVKAKL